MFLAEEEKDLEVRSIDSAGQWHKATEGGCVHLSCQAYLASCFAGTAGLWRCLARQQ